MGKDGMHWWLYLQHFSGKAYEAIRESGCISLPSQRTIRDYSNAGRADAGFSPEVDQQLLQASKLPTSPDYHWLLMLLLDKMHKLVYNKHNGKLVVFLFIWAMPIITYLSCFEELLWNEDDESATVTPIAKLMMVFHGQRNFTTLKFPNVVFPC